MSTLSFDRLKAKAAVLMVELDPTNESYVCQLCGIPQVFVDLTAVAPCLTSDSRVPNECT